LSLLVRRLHGRRQGRQIEPQKAQRSQKEAQIIFVILCLFVAKKG
jgi:hypothetical protein